MLCGALTFPMELVLINAPTSAAGQFERFYDLALNFLKETRINANERRKGNE
jgi:hypothetical protein